MRRAGLTVFIVLLLAFGVVAANTSVDFSLYHRAATQVLQDDYTLYPGELAAGGRPESTHYFKAMPAIAWLFVPFALLPLPVASFLFFALKVVGLAGIVIMTARMANLPASRGWHVAAGATLAAGGFVVEELRYGNAHILVMCALVFALYLIRNGRVMLPGALVAISIAIKVTPLLLVAYFALTRRIKVAAATIAVVGVLLLLPAAVVGVDANGQLLTAFASSAQQMADQPRNHSLRGVILRYLTSAVPEAAGYPRLILLNLSTSEAIVIWLTLCLAVTAVMVGALRRDTRSTDAMLLKDSLVMVAMLILSPHTQRIYFSALFFPCCVLMALLVKYPDGWSERPIRWTLAALAIAGTLLPIVLPGRRLSLAYEMASPYLLLSLILFGVIVFLIRWSDHLPAAGDADRRASSRGTISV
jgi:hypothetical protein